MNYRDTEALTMQAVTQYYKGNVQPFYEILHPNTVMLSVSRNQLFEGKKKVMEAFRIENESGISYDIENISCKTYRIEASACYAVLDSDIITCYPNGILIRVNQRLSVIWKYIRERNIEKEGVEKEGWYGMHIHVSLAQEALEAPANVAHFSEAVLADMLRPVQNEERVTMSDTNACLHYVPRSQIIYMEAAAHQTLVCLKDGENFYVSKQLKTLEEEIGEGFVRTHRKYLVNVRYVDMMKGYKLRLKDGKILPMSKGNVAEVRKNLDREMH